MPPKYRDSIDLTRPYWRRQVAAACIVVAIVIGGGGVALYILTDGHYSLWETVYFALVTVSTVGFGEPGQLDEYPGTHLVVALMIVAGVGAIAFFESTMTAMLLQGAFGRAFRKKRMIKKLAQFEQHIIVAGCGRTGKFCVRELAGLGRAFVIIDQDEEMLERLNREYGGKLAYVVGDATDDQTLIDSGVNKAWGLVTSLTEDRDNVFVVLSARTLNPKLHIVSKVQDIATEPKLLKAGANRLVSPHQIGGFRLVSELVRPRTMEFLDGMRSDTAPSFRIEDVRLESASALVGKSLRDSPIRSQTNALIVAVREVNGTYVSSPRADYVLRADSHLIVVGEEDALEQVREMAAASRALPA